MIVDEETHNWSKQRENMWEECSVINGTYMLHTYTPRLRIHLRRQGAKSVGARGKRVSSWNSVFWTGPLRNLLQLSLPAQDWSKIKTANIPPLMGRGTWGPTLLRGYWQLVASGEGESVFFRGVSSGRYPCSSWYSNIQAHLGSLNWTPWVTKEKKKCRGYKFGKER